MKRAIVILITLFTLLCAVSVGVFPARGQEAAILVKSKEVRSQFPEGIEFELIAETVAPEKIKEIKLEMRIKGSARGSYAYLEFDPGTMVEGKYLLRASGAQHKPPGIMIEYRFIITDSAGRTLEMDREDFLYLDNRFQWERVAGGAAEVYYYGPTKERAELILKASADTVTRMCALLGVVPAQPVRIIAYNNSLHMAPALSFQAKAVEAELLTQGQAWYDYGVLLMLAGDPRADGIASHEVTHMLVREATEGAFVDLPLWLNEGLAEYANVNPGETYDRLLSQAIAAKKVLRLRHMQASAGTPSEILLMYAQSRSVVKYLIDTYGEGKIRALFTAFKQGLRIDEALERVYGFDQDGLDNAWRKSQGLPPLEPTPEESVPAAKANRWGFGCARAPAH